MMPNGFSPLLRPKQEFSQKKHIQFWCASSLCHNFYSIGKFERICFHQFKNFWFLTINFLLRFNKYLIDSKKTKSLNWQKQVTLAKNVVSDLYFMTASLTHGWTRNNKVSIQHINIYELSEATVSIIKYKSKLILMLRFWCEKIYENHISRLRFVDMPVSW